MFLFHKYNFITNYTSKLDGNPLRHNDDEWGHHSVIFVKVVNDAKTSWSWGRMVDILSEGRKIESRRQLEAIT